MDNERRQLNEGESCTSPTGFIHIDDYKLAKSAREKEDGVNEEEEVDNENQKLLEHRKTGTTFSFIQLSPLVIHSLNQYLNFIASCISKITLFKSVWCW
jgi:hypothetical protein